MSRRSMMKDLKENTDISNYQKAKEGKFVAEAADWRNLNAKAFITDITPEVENDRRESVKKTCSDLWCRLKWFTPLFTRI
jgi:hypothetical protein